MTTNTNNTLEKHTGSFGGPKFRMQIKGFKYRDDMYTFLGKQSDNTWKESSKGLKPGTYAHAGGQWHNVKSLDSSVLAHI